MPAFRRTFYLLAAMLLGVAMPGAHRFSSAIPLAIFVMLWWAFLDVRPVGFRWRHLGILGANWAVGLGAFVGVHGAAWLWGLGVTGLRAALPPGWCDTGGWVLGTGQVHALAVAALLVGLTPTATASAVVTGLLGGRVEFVASAVLLTNLCAGLLFPLALPGLMGGFGLEFLGQADGGSAMAAAHALAQGSPDALAAHLPPMQTWPFLQRTLGVVIGPLLLAQAMRVFVPQVTGRLLRWRGATFYVWLGVLFLVTANASWFLRGQWRDGRGEPGMIAAMAGVAATLCAVNFALGWRMGGREFRRETSQSLGQKNTILTIWIALTYAGPLVALAPTFYVICHNSYNAWQLARSPGKAGRADAAELD